VQKRAEKLTRTTNLQPPQKRTFQVKRPAARRMSRVLEKAGKVGRTRNLQMRPRRERMFPVNRLAQSSMLSSREKV
jgi:hypothetical protein